MKCPTTVTATVTATLTAATLALGLGLAMAPPAPALAGNAAIETTVAGASLSEKKRTQPGLYITAAETAAVLAGHDDVVLIDVRSPEETMLVGYPNAADVNIPFKLINPAHELAPKKGSYKMMPNAAFIGGVKTFLDGKDPMAVVVMCRSGGRSADAVNALVEAGVSVPLYSMVDGFEGDKNDVGERVVNGWKNAGLPWTYKVTEGYLQGVQ